MGVLKSIQILQDQNTSDPNSISCLGEFKNLERLDLSFNSLTSLEGLESCLNLKWLSVANNKLESLKGIEMLTKLLVLNAGKNKLRSMSEVKSLVELRALILNDNKIVSICKLDQMKDLNTLVLSRNPVCEIGESLAKSKSMTKLSLSNCQIQKIGSSLKSCTELKELRLAHNDITTIPGELVHNRRLQNLDLGNNLITKGSDLKVLASLIYLKTLNLQGNPIAEKESLIKKVKKLLTNLQVFNAKPTDKRNKKESDVAENSPGFEAQSGVQKDTDASPALKKLTKRILGDESADMHMSNSRDQEVKGSSSKKHKTNEINISETVEIQGEAPDVTIGMKSKKETTGKHRKVKALDTNGDPDIVVNSLDKKTKGKVKLRESNGLDHDTVALNDADESIDKKPLPSIDANVVVDKRKGKHKKKGLAAEALRFSPDAEVGLGGESTWG